MRHSMARMKVADVLAQRVRAAQCVAGDRADVGLLSNRTRFTPSIPPVLSAAMIARPGAGGFILSRFVNYFTKISPSVVRNCDGNDPALPNGAVQK
jgi:hypothetical protein